MIEKKSSADLLRESVIELVSEKPFHKVTVTETARNCRVSIATFYNYYRDIYDLIRDASAAMLHAQLDQRTDQPTLQDIIDDGVAVIELYPDFFCHLLTERGLNNFCDTMHAQLSNALTGSISEHYGIPLTEELRAAVDIYLYGIAGYLRKYLQSGQADTHASLKRRILSCAPLSLQLCL